jgi:hypothetical protein
VADKRDVFDLNNPTVKEFFRVMKLDAAREVVDRLNRVLAADPETMTSLLETRFFCSKTVESPDCPAVPYLDERGNLQLGLLGVINGLLPEELRVVAHYDDNGRCTQFTLRQPEVACAEPTPAPD